MFKPTTLTKLNNAATKLSKQIIDGLKRGMIGSDSTNVRGEVKSFIRHYTKELTLDHGINYSNIVKTPKQVKFLIGLVAHRIEKAGF